MITLWMKKEHVSQVSSGGNIYETSEYASTKFTEFCREFDEQSFNSINIQNLCHSTMLIGLLEVSATHRI